MTTATVTESIDVDTYLSYNNPTYNYGASGFIYTSKSTTYTKRTLLKIPMPSRPKGAGKIIKIKLYLYQSATADLDSILAIYQLDKLFIEGTGSGSATGDGATWNTYNGADNWDTAGGDYTNFIALKNITLAIGWKFWDISNINLDWDESDYIIIKASVEVDVVDLHEYRSAEYATAAYRPEIEITYEDALPTLITDLKIIPNPEIKTQPKITWTANGDEDFLRYKLYRGFRTSGTTNLATTILNQGEVSWIDNKVTWTQGSTIYYRMYVDDNTNKTTGGTFGGQGSNIPSATRPTSVLGKISDWTPNSWEEITAYVRGSGGTLKKAFYNWGDGGEGWTTSMGTAYYERNHTYTKATTITFKHRTENTDGFQSDLITAGSTIVVADIAPESVIRASPPRQKTTENILFSGKDSYCRSSNREISWYRFDKDGDATFDKNLSESTFITSYASTGSTYCRLFVVDDNDYVSGFYSVKTRSTNTATFVDYTGASLSTGTADVTFCEIANEVLYLGTQEKFDDIFFKFNTVATASWDGSWWYSKGSRTWSSFVPTDGTAEMIQSGYVSWDSDSTVTDWAKDSWSGNNLYWIRLRCTTAGGSLIADYLAKTARVDLTLETEATFNFDNTTNVADGYEVVTEPRERDIIIIEALGISKGVVDVGELRARTITLRGVAHTDIDANGIPDDIENIAAAEDANKKAMIKDLEGNTKYGYIRGFVPSWSVARTKERTWTCAIVLI